MNHVDATGNEPAEQHFENPKCDVNIVGRVIDDRSDGGVQRFEPGREMFGLASQLLAVSQVQNAGVGEDRGGDPAGFEAIAADLDDALRFEVTEKRGERFHGETRRQRVRSGARTG